MMSRSSLGNVCSLLVVFVVALVSLPAGAQSRLKIPAAQKSEAPASIPRPTVQQMVVGLSSPVYVTNAHDGSNRLFILEQAGRIKVVQPGSTSPTLFLNITTRVLSGGERGLLGLAFHPQYSTNRRFFVDYIRQSDGSTVVAEYQVSAANANVADTTEKILLTIPQPSPMHKAGMLEFGPDGFFY